ncbi:MAG: excinuclease ABC subunit UvrA [Acidobacteriota bacterium]
MSDLTSIIIRGARVNNLKNITFSLPINQLTVVTGVSGSGKSSLAFDTVYAEGQRRYVESMSAYARQFLERMDKPDIDEAIGICPAIAINQKNSTRNPRSTVATQTEIFDYLRLLYARIGITRCRNCGAVVKRDTPESIADEVLQLPEGTRFFVLFPAAAGTEFSEQAAAAAAGSAKTKRARSKAAPAVNIKAHLMSLMQRGFTRLYDAAKNEAIELQTPDSFAGKSFDNVFVLVDRLAVKADVRSRLVDSIEACYREGHGQAVIQTVPAGDVAPQQLSFSEKFQCKNCGLSYIQPEPQLFSFNNPFGACPTCQGFGNTIGLDMNLVIPNRELSLEDGAIEPFTKPQFEWWRDELKKFAKREAISMTAPFAALPADQQYAVLEGRNGFDGVKGLFDWLETKKYKLHVRVMLSKYRGYTRCPDCKGGRLRQEARDVYVSGKPLPEVVGLSIKDARIFFDSLELTEEQTAIADRLLKEIRSRLRFLDDVGLDYLSLDRLASTLSGGEAQRIQLATHLGSSLVGALYVLDEPSIGLHPRDSERLIGLLKNLRDIGNTVLVVEHEAEMMRAADHILDIGPGAGELGGEVIYEGNFENLLKDEHSLTAKYLRNEVQIKTPKERRSEAASNKHQLTIRNARAHNLKNIDVTIPLGQFVCITGVSGSGKSTLVYECLYAGLKKQRGDWTGAVGDFAAIEGGKFLDDIILVDQSPIGRTPRSNPVTYIKAYDAIRETFASTREAQARSFNPSHFSFNVPGGRCDVCEGDGTVTVEMQFLADVALVCEECGGKRFKSSVLEIKYRGKNIHEVLQMTVREGIAFFSQVPRIAAKLKVLEDVGLGYLRLGQSATTLSGGEAQRVKLASYLSKKAGDKSLYIFDEPTTGLHFDDINKLLASFRRLLESGASLIVIEHNMDVIKTADWIIDLGPEGGIGGGEVVVVGTPEEIIKHPVSHTGKFLRAYLGG